ncbi:SWIM zinc finger family protein [Metabacillus fastidiosus]|uniref:SWIM zinc finger family protein n=1 Tax=Metabacillus fastidiosus TaxID=1458 RepID=UPI003D268E89
MLDSELRKEQVLGAGEQIKRLLPANDEHSSNLIKRGLVLYRQGNVYNIKTTSDSISAKVQDVTSVQVRLNFEFFNLSSCSCPSNSICKHIIATFLYIYANVDRLATFIDHWKEDKDQQNILTQLKRASSLLKSGKDYDENSLSSWIAFFDDEYEQWRDKADFLSHNQLVQSLYLHYYPSIKLKAPASPEMKQFFNIQAAVTTFIKMAELLNKTKPDDYMLQHIFSPYLLQLVDEVRAAIKEMKRYALPFALDPLLEDSIGRFRDLLFCSEYYEFERLSLYRTLWLELLRRDKWIAKEREELAADQENYKLFPAEYDLARMHMDFLQSKDDHLFKNLAAASVFAFPYTFDWIEDLIHKKNIQRLSKWFSFSVQIIPQYINAPASFEEKRGTIHYFMGLVKRYVEQTKNEQFYEDACQAALPYSFSEYHDFLLHKQKYRKWIEVQALLGFSIVEIDPFYLREAEKAEPKAVLPLYHHAVEEEIKYKTRQNYKTAVKYLKKLKTIYRKLKKEEVFENYLMRISEEHRRLRAFQEELRKGKLIHA